MRRVLTVIGSVAILFLQCGLGAAADPNSSAALRLLIYRLNPSVLAIIPLQSVMEADLAAAGAAPPWPALRDFIEDADPAVLPSPWHQHGTVPPEVTGLPFYSTPGQSDRFALPSGGRVSESVLGIGYASISEIAEHPAFLARPEVRAYVLDVLNRVDRVPNLADHDAIVQLHQLLMVATLGAAVSTAQEVLRVGPRLIQHPTPGFLVGSNAAECAYNAAVGHDQSADVEMRRYIGDHGIGVTASSGQSMRSELAQIPTGQWSTIYHLCRAFAESLLMAGSKT
jgi:hypothetical protein